MASKVDQLIEKLAQTRDELEVQVNLAAADVRDEWQALEHKWEQLRGRAKAAGEVAEETADEVGEALELAAGELKKGFERIRGML